MFGSAPKTVEQPQNSFVTVPSGLADEDGLPAGVQVLAPAMADDRVYRVGAALETLLQDRWGGPLVAPELEGV